MMGTRTSVNDRQASNIASSCANSIKLKKKFITVDHVADDDHFASSELWDRLLTKQSLHHSITRYCSWPQKEAKMASVGHRLKILNTIYLNQYSIIVHV